MGTKFKDIYSLNSIIKDDSRLKNKTSNQLYELYFLYLKYAISYFQYDCNKDLTSYIPFLQEEYFFASDGIDKQYSLSPPPPNGCEFYVGFKTSDDLSYIQTLDYSVDLTTNILIINTDIPYMDEVYISGFVIGEFVDTLNLVEQRILSEGLNVPYDEEFTQRQSLLSQMVYGGSSKIYSQSQHLKEVKEVEDNQYFKKVKSMINDYSYKSNSLNGLGGGLT